MPTGASALDESYRIPRTWAASEENQKYPQGYATVFGLILLSARDMLKSCERSLEGMLNTCECPWLSRTVSRDTYNVLPPKYPLCVLYVS